MEVAGAKRRFVAPQLSPRRSPGRSGGGWRLQFRYRERKAPWGHAPLRGSRRESAVAQLFSLIWPLDHLFIYDYITSTEGERL